MKTKVIPTARKGEYYSFPLFWTIPYDRYIPIQTLIITLLRNVMLTVPRELGQPVRKPVETSAVYFGNLKTFILSVKLENIRIGTSLNILVTQDPKT